MKQYKITNDAGDILGTVQAENASGALDAYCAGHPDDDTGFPRGGLRVDDETHGEKSASVRTDGGRISADREINEHVAADTQAAKCGCGGACPACAAHQEWLQSLSDEEREEFGQIVEGGIYA